VWDVAVDIRRGSPAFGHWFGCALSDANRRQLYIPPGFAHGFLVLSDRALFVYKCTEYYDASAERTLLWDDPALGIDWPEAPLLVSGKDQAGRPLAELPESQLPEYCHAGEMNGGSAAT
ncbi:MAG: dTDP-4-dehydrorhamnose 3,5-epimerase family protein, partial [Longimicrobiales bacterium]